jgi:hypothetical protein
VWSSRWTFDGNLYSLFRQSRPSEVPIIKSIRPISPIYPSSPWISSQSPSLNVTRIARGAHVLKCCSRRLYLGFQRFYFYCSRRPLKRSSQTRSCLHRSCSTRAYNSEESHTKWDIVGTWKKLSELKVQSKKMNTAS